jgi:hypothetical protein
METTKKIIYILKTACQIFLLIMLLGFCSAIMSTDVKANQKEDSFLIKCLGQAHIFANSHFRITLNSNYKECLNEQNIKKYISAQELSFLCTGINMKYGTKIDLVSLLDNTVGGSTGVLVATYLCKENRLSFNFESREYYYKGGK